MNYHKKSLINVIIFYLILLYLQPYPKDLPIFWIVVPAAIPACGLPWEAPIPAPIVGAKRTPVSINFLVVSLLIIFLAVLTTGLMTLSLTQLLA